MSRIEQLIGEIEEYIDSCKFQPLSTSKIIVNKDQMDELLRELRMKTPDEIKRYQKIISNKDAILPDFIIPYSGYGLFFILRVLAEYLLHLSTVEKLCERFSITLSQLHRWLELFRVQKQEWLGTISSMETSDISFLKSLLLRPGYSDFASAFVRRFTKSFLQSHKNPAPYCQQVFVP